MRLEDLQPWEDRQHPTLQHAHAFHMRYYHTALAHRYALERFVHEADQGDRNTLRVGVLVIAPFPRR